MKSKLFAKEINLVTHFIAKIRLSAILHYIHIRKSDVNIEKSEKCHITCYQPKSKNVWGYHVFIKHMLISEQSDASSGCNLSHKF